MHVRKFTSPIVPPPGISFGLVIICTPILFQPLFNTGEEAPATYCLWYWVQLTACMEVSDKRSDHCSRHGLKRERTASRQVTIATERAIPAARTVSTFIWLVVRVVTTLSKVWVCSRLLDETVGSNPAGSIDVCLVWVWCIVKKWSLRRAGYSSIGVLPSVACAMSAIAKARNERLWPGIG
jgi:hypothetical protein